VFGWKSISDFGWLPSRGLPRSYSAPEAAFEEITIDVLQARFWITNGMVRRLFAAHPGAITERNDAMR
jgi:hypothetical protein